MMSGIRRLSILIVCISELLLIHGTAESASTLPLPRTVLNFNTDWLYAPVDYVNGSAATIDESPFVKVCLPHANKVLARHRVLDLQSYRMISWYRRHFTLPSAWAGRRVTVTFDGVATVASVYVNGTLIGDHQGAYTPFSFDLSHYVNFGKENVIAVRVDAQQHNDIPPEGDKIDYLVFGGIVRGVRMTITDPVAIDWLFVSTPTVSSSRADVLVRTKISVTGGSATAVSVKAALIDKAGVEVAVSTTPATVPAGGADTVDQTMTIASPHLWHPDDPYRYTVRVTLLGDNGVLDSTAVMTGLRNFTFDKQSGLFSINGAPFKLRGLDRHEMFPWIGRAAPGRLQRHDADLLKYNLGCNIVRCSHYPQSPAFLDRCDEIGLCVIEEIPGWQYIGDAAWQAKAIDNVEAMIVRDRNHPAVISWGVRINESVDRLALYGVTNSLARAIDPTRPTHGVRNFTNSDFLEDIYTYNDFSGTIANPLVLPWLVTEFGGHTYPTHSWDPEARLRSHMLLHASVQNASYGNSRVAGALGWCAFDYNTTGDFGEENVCFHGVADIFRIKKFAGWFYQSQRDPARYGPMIHLADFWRAADGDTVFIASNCDSVELFVNGVAKGMQRPALYQNLPHPLFRYPGIAYASGTLEATGYFGGVASVHDRRTTPGAPARITITANDSVLVADGGDMTEATVTVVDSNGQAVPGVMNRITFAVRGPGTLYGENPLLTEDGKAACFIQSVVRQTGVITLIASSTGLQPDTIVIRTVPMTDNVVPGGTAVRSLSSEMNPFISREYFVVARPGVSTGIPRALAGQQGVVSVFDIAGRLVDRRKGLIPNRFSLSDKKRDAIRIVRIEPSRIPSR
jgi:beta-galactosidase